MHPRASGGPAARLGWAHAPAAIALALLAACGSTPRPGGPSGAPEPRPGAVDSQRDGPPADPPPDLISRPDPEPRVEPVRSGGPNKPYEVLGQRYTPLGPDAPVVESGLGSWYGRKFHGRPTASGELYDMYASSAAHRTMPIPSYALVRNPANGREVVVRVNDRGPFHPDRIIDLSYAAALKLGILRGVTRVEVRRLTHEEIRTGRWRGDSNWARADTATPARPSPIPEAGAALPATPAATVATAAATTAPAATPAVPPAGATPSPSAAPAPASLQTATSAPVPVAAGAAVPVAATAAELGRGADAAAAGYWVQLGAFRQRQTANELRDRLARDLAWLEPWLAIFDDRTLFRLQAGPFATRSEAQGTADRIRSTAPLQPMVLQRR